MTPFRLILGVVLFSGLAGCMSQPSQSIRMIGEMPIDGKLVIN